jgi:tetratricopeptide (TPR) repeat protein
LRGAAIEASLHSSAPRIGFLLAVVALVVLGVRQEEIGTAPTARSIEHELGGRAESEHFTILFDEGLSREDVECLVEDHEFRLAQLLRFLEWDALPEGRRIRSIVYPTPDLKKRLMGAKHTSFADPYDRTMHLNAERFPHPVLKHELTHVLSASFAGPLRFNPHIGIHEGLAVAADWEEDRLTPDQWAAAMRATNLLPGVSQASSLAFWTLPSARAYLAMGSFSRFLIDRFGVGAYQRFFRTNDAEAVYGRPLATLEGEWFAHLDTVRVTEVDRAFAETRLGRRAIFERRCPREVAERSREGWDALEAGRAGAALRAFERAAFFAPEDPDVQLGRFHALFRLDRGDEARALGEELLATEKLPPRLRESVHDVLGNDAWRRGAVDEARRHFEAILDTRATEHLVRASILKIPTLEQPEFRRVLGEEAPPIETGISLALVAERGPHAGFASYLLGRRLFESGGWPEAAEWLRRAIADSMVSSHPEVDCEARWLLGKALYRARSWDEAAGVFDSLFVRARTPAEALRASSWIERIRWRRTWDDGAVRVTREDP